MEPDKSFEDILFPDGMGGCTIGKANDLENAYKRAMEGIKGTKIMNTNNEGKKYDKDKLKVELLYKDLVKELESVAQVLTFGSNKYGARNWMNLDSAKERYFAAAIRHINSWVKGELKDSESGLPHLSHAITCLLFVDHLDSNKSFNSTCVPTSTTLPYHTFGDT
jgi:hypothetical protein